MKSIFKHILSLIILFSISSCSEETSLNTDFESKIFIFGNLTNDTQNLSINILKSVPIENTSNASNSVNNATITLFTENPSKEQSIVTSDFTENNGSYSSTSISPVVGNYYWIEVKLSDGSLYKSEKEMLRPLVNIDDISVNKNLIRTIFKDPLSERNFYRLSIVSTGEFYRDYDYQLSNDVLFNGNNQAFIEGDINIYSANKLQVMLENINYGTYQFYSKIESQEDIQYNSDDGDIGQLFATPPINLTGNITNTITNKKALGNFGVVSISTKNIQ